MKELTRHQAESLFLTTKVVSSNIEQDNKEMRIRLNLSNNRQFMVRYNILDHVKSYFILDPKI